jgi:hypothetical protein
MRELAVLDASIAESTVRLAARGDSVAFARLVADHNASMARVASFFTSDADAATEAVQAAWTIAWRKLGDVRDPARVGLWLVSVAANEARRLVRQQRRRTIVEVHPCPDRRPSRRRTAWRSPPTGRSGRSQAADPMHRACGSSRQAPGFATTTIPPWTPTLHSSQPARRIDLDRRRRRTRPVRGRFLEQLRGPSLRASL